jgi:hypothetical protein
MDGSGEWPTYETLPAQVHTSGPIIVLCLVCQPMQSTIVCLGLVQEHPIYGGIGRVGGLARPAEWVEEVSGSHTRESPSDETSRYRFGVS